MNAVIYARYSSDSQREESIEGQLSNLIRPFRSKSVRFHLALGLLAQYSQVKCNTQKTL